MDHQYTIRTKKGEPLALLRSGRVILGGDAGWDKEYWIADKSEAQAVSVAVDYFQVRRRRRTVAADVPKSTKANIRYAKKHGASMGVLTMNYNLNQSVIKAILRG